MFCCQFQGCKARLSSAQKAPSHPTKEQPGEACVQGQGSTKLNYLLNATVFVVFTVLPALDIKDFAVAGSSLCPGPGVDQADLPVDYSPSYPLWIARTSLL